MRNDAVLDAVDAAVSGPVYTAMRNAVTIGAWAQVADAVDSHLRPLYASVGLTTDNSVYHALGVHRAHAAPDGATRQFVLAAVVGAPPTIR